MKKDDDDHEIRPLETATSDRSSPSPPLSEEPLSSSQSPSSSSDHSYAFTDHNGFRPAAGKNHKVNKLERKGTGFVYRIREHVRMGPRLSETVKGKLSVGAKIIRKGGRENIFRDIFGLCHGEKLLKASQCYLSTTTGPIAGILFVSTQKVCFCSERSINVQSPSGGLLIIPYKLSIPVKKIKGAYERENADNPAQKYIEIVSQDDFEFWFMGFVRFGSYGAIHICKLV
ncbi:GRAM domain-containing protein / ABA-responsive protein-related [Striga hermonthica]|uniref:GRAM domain-containing protein / ABA-responsive protein-related n=1 Tax=Striga hermonthica TaxID=68872 RepID=A0A9N7MXT0_STRHE|nr:GRAM domain-containing protein / ABA-responsive protein-related [Striga hermonthica]